MFVLVVRNNANQKAIEASYLLSAYLDSLSLDYAFIDSSTLYNGSTLEDCALKGQAIDMAVVLGGDGTILHTAKLLSGMDVQILGINFGNLGFLANEGELGVIELVSEALAGELMESARANLDIEIFCESDDESVPCLEFSAFALNEVVVTRGSLGRTINYSLDISGVHIADVSGDGVIVATSTGSTAYALAAGGPIVHPSFDGMIVQPLAPHTLTARAVLSNAQDVISLDMSNTRNGREATLFIDGDELKLPSRVLEVIVKKGANPTKLLYRDGDHFYKYCERTFFTA